MTDPVRVYLCACGPILEEALDLERLSREISAIPGVIVVRHATLCSEEGRRFLADDLTRAKATRVVVGACSPREHGDTFHKVLAEAGLNPYLLAIASLREQAAWVTPDRAEATTKAEALLRAAVARARCQEPLQTRTMPCNTDVLVLGAGVAGLTAARLLAEADRRVVLVETLPAVGGQVARLGELYPGNECASCLLEPLMDEVLHDPRVEVLTASEIEEVLGFLGNFRVSIRRRAPQVDPAVCYGCHTCHEVCPVEVPREADCGLSTRRAIYVPYTGAVPNVSSIDPTHCLRFAGGACDACEKACPFGAIDLGRGPETLVREVGAMVLATGGEMPLGEAPGECEWVVGAAGLERLLSEAGPTAGRVALPGRPPPQSVAILHGVDATGRGPAPRHTDLCCLLAEKYAHALGAKLPGARIHEVVFTGDPAAEGTVSCMGATEHAARAAPPMLRHRLGPEDRILGVESLSWRGALRLSRRGREVVLPVDLVVVLSPLRGAAGAAVLGDALMLEQDTAGFFTPDHAQLRPFRSRLDGVFLAGAAQGPVTVAQAASAGAAAAASALATLVPGRELSLSPLTASVSPELCGACRACTLACPYHAVRMDEASGRAEVQETLCRGCGCCAAACPSGAIRARHFEDQQLAAELDALLSDSQADPASASHDRASSKQKGITSCQR